MKITKLLVLGAMLLVGNSVANAADWIVRQAPTVSDVKAEPVAFEADHQYLLYNTGAKMFFSQGNAWGTRASGHADQAQALRMYFAKYVPADAEWDGQTYIFKIYSSVRSTNYSWHECFFDNAAAMFVDRASQGNYFWEVQDMGNKVYRLKAAQANPDHKSDGTQFVGRDDNVGQDNSNLSDVYDNANAWPLSPMLTEGEGKYVDWVFYDASIFEAYDVAVKLKAEAEAAEAEGVDISAAVAVYNNTNATKAELEKALADVKEARQNNLGNASADHPASATPFIVNPDFVGDDVATGWSGTGFGSYNPKENAEHYEKTYNTYQKIEGLPNGIYAAGVKAFYRAGGAGTAYENYVAKNEASRNAKFYFFNGVDTLFAPIVSPFQGAPTTGQNHGGESSAGGYVIPNTMESGEYYMHGLGLYDNIVFNTVEDGTLTIGVRKDVTITSDWTLFDDFSLTYYGSGADAFQKWYDLTVDSYDTFGGEVAGVYTEQYLDAYKAAFEELRTVKVSTKEEVLAAVAGIEEKVAGAVDALAKNMTLWKRFQELIEDAKSVAGDTGLDPTYTEPLADWYDFDAPDILAAHELTNEELQKVVDEKTAEIDEASKHPAGAGTNMTKLLKNPDFSKDGEGWTIEKASGGNVGAGGSAANRCYEAWNNSAFDIYQVVENAPMGVYEISVQGFYRYGRTAYQAYKDQEIDEVKPGKAPVYIYMNDNATSFTNVYGDPKQITEEEFYKSGSSDYASETLEDGTTLYFPNGMASAAIAFSDGMYTQSAYGVVAKAGDVMRIGVKGCSNQLGDSWCIWDNFKLTFQGYDNIETVQPILEKSIALAEEYLAQSMGKTEKMVLNGALTSAKNAISETDGVKMFNALSALLTSNSSAANSIAIFKQLETANDDLAAAIVSAVCTKEVILEAQTFYGEIAAGLANGTYENADAEALMEQIATMKKKLAVPEEMAAASDENPVDCTGMITNANYDGNEKAGWTSQQDPGVDVELCEMWNKPAFEYYQDLTGLPEGIYELSIQGFYRAGNAFSDDKKAYAEDPTANNNLQLFAKVGEDEIVSDLPRICTATQTYTSTNYEKDEEGNPKLNEEGKKTFISSEDGNWQWVWAGDYTESEDGESATGERACNGMGTAATMFADGNYLGTKVIFRVGEEGNARVGLKKIAAITNDWCIWDSWKLVYYGPNSTKEPGGTSGIAELGNAPKVAKVEFFNVSGARLNKAQKGLVIMKQTMSDGSVKVKKAVLK